MDAFLLIWEAAPARGAQSWGHATLIGRPGLSELPSPLQGQEEKGLLCALWWQRILKDSAAHKRTLLESLLCRSKGGNPINRMAFQIAGGVLHAATFLPASGAISQVTPETEKPIWYL